MLVLASDYSELAYLIYGVAGVYSLLNAGLFLLYYRLARPRELPHRVPWLLTLAALAFTVVGPVGFAAGGHLGTQGVHGILDGVWMAGVPALVGSLLLLPGLRRDIGTTRAWLAPLLGTAFTVVFVSFLPHPGGGGNGAAISAFLWTIPWHLTCIVAFTTVARRAWQAELSSTNCCAECGYSLEGLRGSVCPECGRAKPT